MDPGRKVLRTLNAPPPPPPPFELLGPPLCQMDTLIILVDMYFTSIEEEFSSETA